VEQQRGRGNSCLRRLELFLMGFQRSAGFHDISDKTIGPVGVEKHHPAAGIVEARCAEGECGESACIDAGDFLEVDDDCKAPRVEEQQKPLKQRKILVAQHQPAFQIEDDNVLTFSLFDLQIH
jgi:hypothetical protein